MMLYPRFGRPRRRPAHLPYFLAVLSGVLLVFCFPTSGLYPLAWLALAPFLVALWELKPAEGFKAGLLMGLPYFFGTQYWIYHSINHYGGVNILASLATVFLLAMYLSLYTAAFGAMFSYTIRQTSVPALLLAPVFWVVAEFVRGYAFTGFPWSSIGYSQHAFLPVIQVADLTGVYGVSFLVLAVNGALADLFIIRTRRLEMPLVHVGPTAVGLVSLAVGLALVFGYGYYRLNEQRPGNTLKIAIVQGSIEQDHKWDPAYQSRVLDTYRGLSLDALGSAGEMAGGLPDLIVWPETALPFYWGQDVAHSDELREFAASLGTDLIVGAVTLKDEGRLGNSAVLLGSDGKETFRYDKIHLVPFGEYVPLARMLFFLDKLVEGIGTYAPGKSHARATTAGGEEFGTIVCYEVLFPGLVRKFFRDGGGFMVNLTNDAWFGSTNGPYQHMGIAALRAVENRKPIVRAANSGISGFIDSNGRVTGRLGLFKRGVTTREIRTDETRTFYTRYGDIFVYLCFILTVLLLAIKRRS